MTLKAGDTFFAPWPEGDDIRHLFFVISDPSIDRQRVLVVPLMTWDEDYKESTCILRPGEHRFVRHDSYVDYGCAEQVAAGYIEERLASGEFRGHDPAGPELLGRIREGAAKSDRLKLLFLDVLEEQGLVEPL